MNITPFEALVLSHLVGDWLLQTPYQAINKMHGSFFNRALWTHCFLYTLTCVPAILYFSLSYWSIGIIFGTHLFIDRRWPIVKLLKMKSRDPQYEPSFWLVIVVDQVVHIVILAACICLPH